MITILMITTILTISITINIQVREILPRIGYTSLPILAISSLENRGVIELKKELASLVVRNTVEIKVPGPVEFVNELFENHEKYEKKMMKATRSWKPLEKAVASGKDVFIHVVCVQ
jgi:hypothetical protein